MNLWSSIKKWMSGSRRTAKAELGGVGGGGSHYDISSRNRATDDAFSVADNYDSDRCNSPVARQLARNRSRLETDNNPSLKGAIKTICNYEIGMGPTVHVEHENEDFAKSVEAAFGDWQEATNFVAKLWQMDYAEVQDGESFARLGRNPHLKHPERLNEPFPIELDFLPFEADRCYTLWLPYLTPNRIDGIWFDDWGNPTYYDILRYHPGGVFPMPAWLFDTVPAQYVLHQFSPERPGQHRGMPMFASSLGMMQIRRRYTLATVEAAETAANFGVVMKTNMPPGESADLGSEALFVRLPRNNMTQLPEGWEAQQLKAEHPTQTYEMFSTETLNEAMRPSSMSLNVAKCDSSRYNMASGQLDMSTFWLACSFRQRNITCRVVNPLFRAWYAEARNAYRVGDVINPKTGKVTSKGTLWRDLDGGNLPTRTVLWQGMPKNDRVAEQDADEKGLATGTIGMDDIWARSGKNWRKRAEKNARALGFADVDEYLAWLRSNLTISKGGAVGGTGESPISAGSGGAREVEPEVVEPPDAGVDDGKKPATDGDDADSIEAAARKLLAETYPGLARRLNGHNGHNAYHRKAQAAASLFVEVPDIRQDTDYRCGAAAAMSVGKYFGVGPDTLEQWSDELGTTAAQSTSPEAIVSYLSGLGLAVNARQNMSVDDLAAETAAGRPVIVCCQDYVAQNSDPRDEQAAWDYGHWMTCLGVIGQAPNRFLVFQDSSEENMERLPGGDVPKAEEDPEYVVEEPGRRFVSEKRWIPAWHDEAVNGVMYDHYGISVGLPERSTPTAALLSQEAQP